MFTTAYSEKTLEQLKNALFNSSDIIVREFDKGDEHITVIFIDTLVDELKLRNYVLEPITQQPTKPFTDVVTSKTATVLTDIDDAVTELLKGFCAILSNKRNTISLIDVSSTTARSIMESPVEQSLKGSHDGLVESVILNIYQIRKRVETPQLVTKYKKKGTYTRSKMAILYVDDLVDKNILKEVERRIDAIDHHFIQNPGFIIEAIEDRAFSPFPQIIQTERPDRVAANLMGGKIVLILDGSPVALILPANFASFYQAAEDYNTQWYFSSVIRFLRVLSFFITLMLPALYIALVTYHPELIPSELIYSLKSSLNAVPFPPLVEVIIMMLVLELVREVSIRMPKAIAATMGIVGAIIIGQAVVSASLISNIIIVIVALTAIMSFASPSTEMSNATRILSFPLMLLAYFFGFIGVVFGIFLLIFHLCTLTSFGAPYFAPFGPIRPMGYMDTLFRAPISFLRSRHRKGESFEMTKDIASRSWQNE